MTYWRELLHTTHDVTALAATAYYISLRRLASELTPSTIVRATISLERCAIRFRARSR